MKKKIIYIVVAVIVFIALLMGIYLLLNDNNNLSNIKHNEFTLYDTKGELTKYDNTLFVNGYIGSYDEAYYITGKISSEKAYKFVVITYNLYNSKGNLLGLAQAGVNDVLKDDKIDFKALSLTTTDQAKQVTRYEIKEIIGQQ